MADEEQDLEPTIDVDTKKKSSVPMMVMGAVVVIALLAVGGVMMMRDSSQSLLDQPPVEYTVAHKMYQLKDGSYLKLSFSIVVAQDKLDVVTNIIENEAPGRLPDGINMILGNKGRDDLISSSHQREAFARELKKMVEERVFAEFNRRQLSSKDAIEVKEVLICDFVTQSG